MRFTGSALVLLLTASALGAAEVPIERYYMTLFGAQSVPPRTSQTHTWATFVRTHTTGAGEIVVAVDTVSWMPADLKIRAWALRRQPGVNLTFDETIDWIASFGGRVSSWGPYEIDADRYGRFLSRKADLESGTIAYRALGAVTFKSRVSNCGQSFARSSPIVGRRYLQPTPSPGETGTSKLAERYLKAGALQDGGAEYPWLLAATGADRYPMVPRRPGERIPRFVR